MFKTTSIILMILALTACGDENTSGSSVPWEGPRTASGFPVVSGTYSFNSSDVSYSCTNGERGTTPGVALEIAVTQVDSRIETSQTTEPNVPGVTVLEFTPSDGNVTTGGEFLITQTLTATIDGIAGTVTLNYTTDGNFSVTGWSGTYRYSAFVQSQGVTCDYTSSFSGEKIVVSTSTLTRGSALGAVKRADSTIGGGLGWAF